MTKRVVPFGRPMIGAEEREAVLKVLAGDVLVHGPMAQAFETQFSAFTGAPHSLSVSSCTAALHLSHLVSGLTHGDEVIVPAQTHVATAHAVELTGAKTVFVDAEAKTGNIDLEQIEAAITPRTKAISIVHFLGYPVEMDRVMQIARKHGLYVVEDCALALGTKLRGKHAGLFGDFGCFSFYPAKHMTTAEGGMLTTTRADLAAKVKLKKAFGVDKAPHERSIPGVYDVVDLGMNYRLNEVQAALGVPQLKRIPGFLKARRENFDYLSTRLRELDELRLFAAATPDFENSYYCLSILLQGAWAENRTDVVAKLKEQGVGCSVYYPRAVPQFTYYQAKYGHAKGKFPVAEMISDTSIALPVGPHLVREDLDYMVDTLKAVFAKK